MHIRFLSICLEKKKEKKIEQNQSRAVYCSIGETELEFFDLSPLTLYEFYYGFFGFQFPGFVNELFTNSI